MLSFDSGLSDPLKLANTTAFWTLKLYHTDESAGDFIGVSDTHRVDGTDIYYGLVSSWGTYQQSLDFFNFTTSTANMTVKLINTENSIQGGRFSDLFSSNNFANRKWELFLNTVSAGTYDTAARMIGVGVISGDIAYDTSYITLTLLDYSSKYHKKLPKAVIQNTESGDDYYHANAPSKNVGQPIPITFGDFSDRTDVGTIPTSGANFDRHFTKAKFPAIITDEWNATNYRTEALIDSVTMNALDTENIYMSVGEHYGACNSSNASKSEADAKVTVKGTDWKVYVPVQAHSTYSSGTNYANMIDSSFSGSPYNLAQSGAGATSVGFRVGKLPNLGVLTAAKLLIDFGTFTGSAPAVNFRASAGAGAGGDVKDTITWNGGDDDPTVTGLFDSDEQAAWDIETEFFLTIDNTGGSGNMHVDINEVGLEFQVEPSQSFEKQVIEQYEEKRVTWLSEPKNQFYGWDGATETIFKTRTKTLLTTANIDYVYASGKGREYGAWIDLIDSAGRVSKNGDEPDPNYANAALIENPVYMIEDILRTELGMDSSTDGSDIDIETFDKAGNAQTDGTKGDIALIFNDAIADIKFAFSQPKFIHSKDLIEKIGAQILSWIWISGSGKFKIRTLLRPSDTFAADKTVNFHDIALKSISRTPLNDVRNDITVNYDVHYAQNHTQQSVNTTDSTSQGTATAGNNQTLKLEMDADCILDTTTATQLADAYKTIFKDRKVMLTFNCVRPVYNDLEITDIISFTNWDSNIKLYGTAMTTTDYFMITEISKSVNSCSIKAIQVD